MTEYNKDDIIEIRGKRAKVIESQNNITTIEFLKTGEKMQFAGNHKLLAGNLPEDKDTKNEEELAKQLYGELLLGIH